MLVHPCINIALDQVCVLKDAKLHRSGKSDNSMQVVVLPEVRSEAGTDTRLSFFLVTEPVSLSSPFPHILRKLSP